MKVSELIKALSKLDQNLEVGAGFPAVAQSKDHQESLCRVTGAYEMRPDWESWLGDRFVLIELDPELALAAPPRS